MSESDKQRLEILLKRKQKADSLPEDERKKWQQQYDEICREIIILKQKLGLNKWDESATIKLLIDTSLWVSMNLEWENSDDFFNKNPQMQQYIKDAGNKVDKAFKTKDMDTVKDAIQAYKDACIKVNQICNNPGRQMGFRELLPGEEGYSENPFW